MKKLAIIGTGIAGLGCAYFLKQHYDLTLFEKNDYVGGHSNTVLVQEQKQSLPIDTGFMVFNKVTYPNLTRLFRELDVAIKPAPMSFSVQHLPSRLEYCGSSLNHLFAQRRNLLRPQFWKMVMQINRFNSEASQTLAAPEDCKLTVGEYVTARKYGSDFLNYYLVPMSSAVWSTPANAMLDFPAITLLRFFHNHGFLGLHTQHPWFTVAGGSRCYVEKINASLGKKVKVANGALTIKRNANGVAVTTRDGKTETFDQVIMASHADESLGLLQDADALEQSLLSEFKYQLNTATVHTDEAVMPKTKNCWASWNYRMTNDSVGHTSASTVYWMNSLQGVSERQNYFISINGAADIQPEKILKRINYEHPLFNLKAIAAQARLAELNERNQNLFFCGSYFRYGFHEDALLSALQLARRLVGEVWS